MKTTYRGYEIEIKRDEDAQSPSEWGDDNLFLLADHRQCYISRDGKTRQQDIQAEIEAHKATHWIFPLEAYIHSGVVLALAKEGNFADRQWDVSLVGAVFASKKEWRLSRKARQAALSKVNKWNMYLSGDVWGFVITGQGPGDDSCWGFYGQDFCLEQAKLTVDGTIENVRIRRINQVKTWIRNRVPLDVRAAKAL